MSKPQRPQRDRSHLQPQWQIQEPEDDDPISDVLAAIGWILAVLIILAAVYASHI